MRDLRWMKRSRRSFTPTPATEEADLQALYGSDGTRTRDLRRDRPSPVQRRSTTNVALRSHLHVLFARWLPPLRTVEAIVQWTFGPRVGHEMLSTRKM